LQAFNDSPPSLFQQKFSHEAGTQLNILAPILSTLHLNLNHSDQPLWKLNYDSNFTSKSFYLFVKNQPSPTTFITHVLVIKSTTSYNPVCLADDKKIHINY
jgi:hypothetical protein